MAESLYPTFEIPTINPINVDAQQSYRPAPMFDFDTGDFVRDGANRVVICDGYESFKQWCVKVIKTQRGACLSYTGIGIEGEEAANETSRQAVESAYARTITEMLMMHPFTERVRDFEFEWGADELHISFTIQARDFVAFDIDLNVVG